VFAHNAAPPEKQHDPELELQRARQRLAELQAGTGQDAPGDPAAAGITAGPRRRLAFAGAALALLATAAVATTLALSGHPPASAAHHSPPCRAGQAVTLYLPEDTGSKVGVTFRADCDLNPARHYLLIEELFHVGKVNPHSLYFVKAGVRRLRANAVATAQFVLKEPVHTQAEFYVISVDSGGLAALSQNQVADHGILQLPQGWRRESPIRWHVKGWS
jgi:hypothetical protein